MPEVPGLYDFEIGNAVFALGGDIMLSRPMALQTEPGFLGVAKIFHAADVGFGNLETTIRNPDEGFPTVSPGTYMSTQPSLLDDLKWFGINIVSCANNHAYDYGEGGLLATLRHLDRAGLAHAGTGENLTMARKPAFLETRAGRVALVAITATFFPWARAGERRPDAPGRPGVNPLRATTKYHTTPAKVRMLHDLARELGMSLEQARNKQHFFSDKEIGDASETEASFLGSRFVAGDKTFFATEADANDTADTLKWVREARRAADWVVVSMHSHEWNFESTISAKRRSDLNLPADFVSRFCRDAIDAGADIVVGHGSHTALGVELYKGKPIFHSMGNLIFQNDSVTSFPADAYERFDLSADATPADFLDARSDNDRKGHPGDPKFWESMVAQCRFSERRLAEVTLYPIDLGHGRPRGQRGRPVLAGGQTAARILDRVKAESAKFGTAVEREDGLARIKFPG